MRVCACTSMRICAVFECVRALARICETARICILYTNEINQYRYCLNKISGYLFWIISFLHRHLQNEKIFTRYLPYACVRYEYTSRHLALFSRDDTPCDDELFLAQVSISRGARRHDPTGRRPRGNIPSRGYLSTPDIPPQI